MDKDLILSEEKGEIVLYQPNDNIRLEVRLQDETVWLTQQQMAELFNTTRNNITLHIGNIFKEGELEVNSVRKESLLTAADGKKYRTKFYNLDVIISVGYRVKSPIGTRFRQWANGVLKDYLLRGYAVHQQAMALQQINLRIDAQNERLARIEDTIDQQQQQLDFVVRRIRGTGTLRITNHESRITNHESGGQELLYKESRNQGIRGTGTFIQAIRYNISPQKSLFKCSIN